MITAALLGNPNVGKTTLFNLLTGSNQYVGNWAGVTVDKKEGYIEDKVKIVDLPGIYAMDTYSNEEKVSKEFLQNGNVDVIINIIDASNINRNLYLTTQLKAFGKPIILVLNMIDAAKDKGISINYELLSKSLNVSVVPIIASKNVGTEKVVALLTSGDFLRSSIDNDYHFDSENETFKFIDDIINKCLIKSITSKQSITEKIDNLVLNKFLAYPLFLLILYLIFKVTFSWVGVPLSDLFKKLLNDYLVVGLNKLLLGSSIWFKSLLINGIIAGVGAVIVFLPVILILFLCISFLEDSGYMARAAFIMDKFMRKIGLSGKAFIPLIVGFGCSVPAIMSARTLESEKDRKLTALLVPLMSCNAKLPVYALFASIFFKGYETSVVFFLYFLGIFLAFGIGLLFKNTIFKNNEEPFLIELPDYKMPEFKNLMQHTWEKGKGFLRKAGTIIFSISVIVWFLSNFNFTGMVNINSSFLSYIGKAITPIFIPLGFSNWQNSVSLLLGLMAKEVVVGTMGVLYGNLSVTLPTIFSTASSLSFLVFVLLYTPCVSVMVTMKKEYGNKMALFSIAYQLSLAWVMSFIVFNVAKLIF